MQHSCIIIRNHSSLGSRDSVSRYSDSAAGEKIRTLILGKCDILLSRRQDTAGTHIALYSMGKGKGKVILLQTRWGPEGG